LSNILIYIKITSATLNVVEISEIISTILGKEDLAIKVDLLLKAKANKIHGLLEEPVFRQVQVHLEDAGPCTGNLPGGVQLHIATIAAATATNNNSKNQINVVGGQVGGTGVGNQANRASFSGEGQGVVVNQLNVALAQIPVDNPTRNVFVQAGQSVHLHFNNN